MAYDIAVKGISDLARIATVLSQRNIGRDPLSGVVDSANKVFFTNYSPLLSSGSLVVQDSSGSVLGGTANYNTGEVDLTNAPASQAYATYTFTPYTVNQQLGFLISGVYVMEGNWPRGLKIVDATGAAADENSANIYLQDAGGGDPLTGRPAQLAYYIEACRYAIVLAQLGDSASQDFQWREGARGMLVDKSKRPANMAQAAGIYEKRLQAVMRIAMDEWYRATGGQHLGAYIGSPMTGGYVNQLEWQTDSIQTNIRGQRSIHAWRPLDTA